MARAPYGGLICRAEAETRPAREGPSEARRLAGQRVPFGEQVEQVLDERIDGIR